MNLSNERKLELNIRLFGGLGNQLFQTASGYALSRKYNKNFSCAYMGYTNTHSNINYIENIFRRINFNENKYYNTFYEPHNFFSIKLEIPNFNLDTQLIGFFQNEKYFSEYKIEIYDLFKIEHDRYLYLINKYKNLDNGYFIHFRRGDYVNNPHYDILDDYYERAFKKIEHLDVVFYILSEDLEYCKKNPHLQTLIKNKKHYYVENENEVNSLYLMSLCKKGGIAANSTFSWWGGYLNPYTDKFVIYPKKWYFDNKNIDIWWEGSIIL